MSLDRRSGTILTITVHRFDSRDPRKNRCWVEDLGGCRKPSGTQESLGSIGDRWILIRGSVNTRKSQPSGTPPPSAQRLFSADPLIAALQMFAPVNIVSLKSTVSGKDGCLRKASLFLIYSVRWRVWEKRSRSFRVSSFVAWSERDGASGQEEARLSSGVLYRSACFSVGKRPRVRNRTRDDRGSSKKGSEPLRRAHVPEKTWRLMRCWDSKDTLLVGRRRKVRRALRNSLYYSSRGTPAHNTNKILQMAWRNDALRVERSKERKKKRKENEKNKNEHAIISAHKSISFIVNATTKRRIKKKENEEFMKFSRFATLHGFAAAHRRKNIKEKDNLLEFFY